MNGWRSPVELIEKFAPKRCGAYAAVKLLLAGRPHWGRRVRFCRQSWPVRSPILFTTCVVLLVCSACAAVTPQADSTPPPARHDDATARHSFGDVRHWVEVFDDPARDAWQKPVEVVQALGIRAGMCVADLGAGTGYFSRYLSTAVTDTGTVFAVEVEPNLVVHLRERAEQEQTRNLVPILGSTDNPRLPAGVVHLVLVVDTMHHIDARIDYLRRLRHVLKPGGRVAIIDFKKEETAGVGPPIAHRLAREEVMEEFRSAGYQLVGEPRMLPYQYFLIFRPR